MQINDRLSTEELSKEELTLISKFLEMASDEFSNHGCNDLVIKNTPEHRAIIEKMEKWNSGGKEPLPRFDKPTIFTYDWYMMSYFAARCKLLATKVSGA